MCRACAAILDAMRLSLRTAMWTMLALSSMVLVDGCRHSGDTFNLADNNAAWQASKTSARQELTEIPPPSKNIYLAIRQEPQWLNPFLSVKRNMIQMRIYLADENASPVDRGGLTRITAARRQVLNVSLEDLPKALASLPNDAWPYGRVVAVGEGITDKQSRAEVSRNLQATIKALNDLGIVVDEWNGPGLTQ